VKVALRLRGEIVGCDALQVYRGFDAATAKPSHADRGRVPHHLVDMLDPRRDFSVADYVRRAERAISDIRSRGRVPLVVGGTGMYLRGLLKGVVAAPPRDPGLRARLRRMADRFGSERLHRWLGRLDPLSAERLHPGDTQRVLRAIEVALVGPGTWSETLQQRGTWDAPGERYACLKLGLDHGREALARRLDERVLRFFEAGLVDEVRGLLSAGVPATANAFKAIGYREVLAALQGGDDPTGVVPEVQRSTRRYAKRQRTWFRKEPDLVWLDAAVGSDALCDRVVGRYEQLRQERSVRVLYSPDLDPGRER
jgi:tRNA dimethylallyltransferase